MTDSHRLTVVPAEPTAEEAEPTPVVPDTTPAIAETSMPVHEPTAADQAASVSSFRCLRDTFTEEQFKLYKKSFWAMPSGWTTADGDMPFLAQLWRIGGTGTISILPILGQYVRKD